MPAAAAELLSAAAAGADAAFSVREGFVAALEEVADGSLAAFGSGCFGDELTGTAAKAGGVSALAVDDGFAVRTVDEIGVTFGESCLGKASAGP